MADSSQIDPADSGTTSPPAKVTRTRTRAKAEDAKAEDATADDTRLAGATTAGADARRGTARPRADGTPPAQLDLVAVMAAPEPADHTAGVTSSGGDRPDVDRPARVDIVQGGAADVAADAVSITQGGIRSATAKAIDVRQGGIANATAQDIAVSMGGVAFAQADRVSVEMGAVGLALAGKARVTQGYARAVLAREARLEQAIVGTLITGRVTVERTTGVLLLVAGRVDGPIKAVFDWRGALAFGAAFGLLWGILRRR